MIVIPEIDDATEKAVVSSAQARDAIVTAYLRLIDYQLHRIQLTIDANIDRADPQLTRILQGLTAGRNELEATLAEAKLWLSVTHLTLNVSRFNKDELQTRLVAAYTTQRPQPSQQQAATETAQMKTRLDLAINQLQEKIADQINSDPVQSSVAANFPVEARKQASVNLVKIVANLRAMHRENRFVAEYGLPANMPAYQSVADGKIVIKIHPTGFTNLLPSKAQSQLLHEGSHALDPVKIVDYVYRDSGLHAQLPALLALGNAANYEQVAADVLGNEKGPKPGGGSPAVRTAVAYATVRITRTWVATNMAAGLAQGRVPGLREYFIGRTVGAPLCRDGHDKLPAPLAVDLKLMADVYDAASVLLDAVTGLRIGTPQRGPLTIARGDPSQPFTLRAGEASDQASGDELQGLILGQLALAAQQTGSTSHVTAGELESIVLNLPDLISKTDLANLKILQDAEKVNPERKIQ